MAKKILIIGGGMMQIPLIQQCNDMSLYTIVIDGNPNAEGYQYADEKIVADIISPELVIQSLDSKEKYDAVITAGTDFSTTVAEVANAFSLPGIPIEVARRAKDKILMRQCFSENNVLQPQFFPAETVEQGKKGAKTIGYPVVAKPADSMGARGVRCCYSEQELLDWFPQAIHYSPSSRVIIEQYIAGRELSLDALIYRGHIMIHGIADRIIDKPPYFVEFGHILPSQEGEEILKQAKTEFIKAIRAIGIENGAAKGDIRINENGAFIGEVAARLSGGFMSGYTYPYASGVNLLEGAIKIALGEDPSPLQPTQNLVSYEHYIPAKPGIVQEITGVAEALAIPEVKNIFLHCKQGDKIVTPKNNVEKPGNVIITAKDWPSAEKIMQEVLAMIHIKSRPVL